MDWSKTERASRLHPPEFGPAGIGRTVLACSFAQTAVGERDGRSGPAQRANTGPNGSESRTAVPFSSFSEFTKGATKGSHSTNPAPSPASPASWANRTSVRKVGGPDHQRPMRLADNRAERRGRCHSSEGGTRDPDDAGGVEACMTAPPEEWLLHQGTRNPPLHGHSVFGTLMDGGKMSLAGAVWNCAACAHPPR